MQKAPVLSPQLRPGASLVGGSKDELEAVAGCFSTPAQHEAACKFLQERQREATDLMGTKCGLIIVTDVDVRTRQVVVKGLRFGTKMERTLSSAQRTLELQFQPASSLAAYASHFVAVNGYSADTLGTANLPPASFLLQEAVSIAFALQVLLDATPGWKTMLGTQKAPVTSSRNAREILQELLDAEEHRGSKRARGVEGCVGRTKKTADAMIGGEEIQGDGSGGSPTAMTTTTMTKKKRRLERTKASFAAEGQAEGKMQRRQRKEV